MTSFFRKRAIRYPLTGVVDSRHDGCSTPSNDSFWLGLLFTLLFVVTVGVAWKLEEHTYIETEKHIETLSYRVKKVGEEALLELPIGIILINEKNSIEWANPYAVNMFDCGYTHRKRTV